MRVFSIIIRVLTGLVFVFSGFVKGVDPWGSAIKLHDYFTAFGWDGMLPYAFFIGSLMNVAEFLIGFCLILGVRVKLASLGAVLFMLIFLPLTLYLAVYNPVSDCGCFGDAIKMSNWGTFYKNIIITAFVLFVFIRRKHFRSWMNVKAEWLTAFVGISIIIGTSWYSYAYLPLIDFLPYKVGNNIPSLMKVPEGMPTDKYEQFITLNDTAANKNIEVTVDTYSNDSSYWGQGTKYKYVSISEPKLVQKGYQPPIHDLTMITPIDGNDITDSVVNDQSYVLIMVSYKLDIASTDDLGDFDALARYAMSKGYRYICLTSSTNDDIEKFKTQYKPSYPFCMTDETVLKSMIRSNPGLLLLKGGTVIEKWGHNSVPSPEDFEKKYK